MSNILAEALEDTKLLKETAIENAKNVLVEAISPNIKEFVDGQLGDGIAEMPTYEAAEEMPWDDEEEETEEEAFAFEAKDDDEDDEDTVEEASEEVVEITAEDLRAALSELVQTEANVTSGFGDEENPNSLADGGLGDSGAPGERGLEDKEKEEMWKDNTPPAAEDWTVKENYYRKYIQAVVKQNKALKNENNQYRKATDKLSRNIKEVNLFNSKLLYTHKLLQNANLTRNQRAGVIEAFDRAESLREVQLVFKSLSESMKITGALVEGKQKRRQRSSRPAGSTGTSKLLEEQVGGSANRAVTRMQELAGILD